MLRVPCSEQAHRLKAFKIKQNSLQVYSEPGPPMARLGILLHSGIPLKRGCKAGSQETDKEAVMKDRTKTLEVEQNLIFQ